MEIKNEFDHIQNLIARLESGDASQIEQTRSHILKIVGDAIDRRPSALASIYISASRELELHSAEAVGEML